MTPTHPDTFTRACSPLPLPKARPPSPFLIRFASTCHLARSQATLGNYELLRADRSFRSRKRISRLPDASCIRVRFSSAFTRAFPVVGLERVKRAGRSYAQTVTRLSVVDLKRGCWETQCQCREEFRYVDRGFSRSKQSAQDSASPLWTGGNTLNILTVRSLHLCETLNTVISFLV